MAQIAVSLVVDKLIPLLAQVSRSLRGIPGEVSDIKDELEFILAFLKDADERVDKSLDNGVKTWVKQVREVAYHIEDVIDEYTLLMSQECCRDGYSIGFLQNVYCLVKDWRARYEIATRVQEIKSSIRELKERSERYSFRSIQGSDSSRDGARWDHRLAASLFIEEAETVGIESTKDLLIGKLVDGVSKRTVISVVGMGGLGKTTLVKKVYDDQKVTAHFECYAWITVSQSYNFEHILRSMTKQFHQGRSDEVLKIDNTDVSSLISELRDYLNKKRYVIVFDDVWKIDFWGLIKYALPDNNIASRIIITTRSEHVANSSKEYASDYVQKLQPLPQEKAWELFCRKAFQSSNDGQCPAELEALSLSFIKRCEGLPLAIVAIGGLLSTKRKVVSEWKRLHECLVSELDENPHLEGIKKVLLLSYHDLPSHLKSCFLFFGIFPEDYSVGSVRLIRQWIAEGFIREKRGKTPEEVAEEYLTELIRRSLVQLSHIDFDEKIRYCRVHDLMRDIILSKSDDLNFCQVLSGLNLKIQQNARRLSLHNYSIDFDPEVTGNFGVRSIFAFKEHKLSGSLMTKLFTYFKLLKILDFQDAILDTLPEEVGNLFHLTYLSLRDTKVKMLPKSIGNLQNLLILDLKRSLVNELPFEINKLHKLRYLLVSLSITFGLTCRSGVKIQEGIGNLTDLQKLYFLDANHSIGLTKELNKLTQLKMLGIKGLTSEKGKELSASIENMTSLVTLDLCSINREEVIDIQHISYPPPLKSLYLDGRLEKFPNWISKLQSLVRVRLYFSRLTDDPLKSLHVLPCLLELWMHDRAYEGEELHFVEGGFQKLKELHLDSMNSLKYVKIDEGTMPVLEELSIWRSLRITEVPVGLVHLSKLRTLELCDMSSELMNRLSTQDGPDYWKVEHIPTLRCTASS